MLEKINNIKEQQHIWIPKSEELIEEKIKTNTWFDITYFNNNNITKDLIDFEPKQEEGIIVKCKKAILYPTKSQGDAIIEWLDIYRCMYNVAIKYYKTHPVRSRAKDRKPILATIPDSLRIRIKKSKIPLQSISDCHDDVISSYKRAFTNIKTGKTKVLYPPKHNEAGKDVMTMYLSKKSIASSHNSFCPRGPMGTFIRTSSSIKNITKDCRLSYNKTTQTFILYVPIESKVNIYKDRSKICILDPGTRVFQTGYTSNSCFEIGKDAKQRIKKLFERIDYVNSSNATTKQKKKFIEKRRQWVKNLVDELHWKTIDHLCSNYSIIVIGNLSTESCLKSITLNKMEKRLLQALSHYKFKQRLEHKCKERNIKYLEVDESYTSKTCGGCGFINYDLGSAKIYDCPECGIKIGRDFNGARNIFIKNLSLILKTRGL